MIEMLLKKDCNRLYSFLITAHNEVILCACRDTHRFMVIGNINDNKLSDIVNLKNKKYKKWIDEQEKDIFCILARPVICMNLSMRNLYTKL